jgi:hypothetical protein
MSTKAFGIFELKNKKFELIKESDLSFYIMQKAIDNKIGVNLGGNVFKSCLGRFKNVLSKIPFELIDDLIDINAEVLFSGDGVNISVCGERYDTGESLVSRMNRVQKFFHEVLKCGDFSKVILDVDMIEDIEDCKFETLKIDVRDFSSKMVESFTKNDNFVPSVRVIIDSWSK